MTSPIMVYSTELEKLPTLIFFLVAVVLYNNRCLKVTYKCSEDGQRKWTWDYLKALCTVIYFQFWPPRVYPFLFGTR
jgi:hypothetical protein